MSTKPESGASHHRPSISERLDRTRASIAASQNDALSVGLFVSTYLPALILALGVGIALPAIPTLARSFHVSFALATGVTTSFLVGNVVGTLPSGWLVDKIGRRKVMLYGPALTALMAFLVATSHSFAELLIYRFFDGCASQMWMIGRLAGISHGAAANQRGRQVSWMFGMNNTGRLAGPVIGGVIAASFGVRAPFFTYAVLALVALIPAWLLTPDTPRQAQDGRKGPALQKISYRALIRPKLAFFGIALFSGLARGPITADLLHLYVAYAYRLGPVQIGYLATGAAALSLPIGFLAGWMMDRFGRKRTLVPGFSGAAVAMAGLAVAAFVRLPLFGYVAIFLAAVAAQSLTGGSVQTIGADVAPPEARGRFLGIWRFAGQGGIALSPVIFAALSVTSYGASFIFVAWSALVVALLAIFKIPETGKAAGDRASDPQGERAASQIPAPQVSGAESSGAAATT